MFDTRKTFSGHVADAVDLMIDFATLGEYGLEPVEPPGAGLRGPPPYQARCAAPVPGAPPIDRFAAQP